MPAARARNIPDLLRIHSDDLAFQWSQRRAALNSRKHTLREYAEINERIEAHVQGLLVADGQALMALLQPQLALGDRDEAFAAAHALLRIGAAAPTHVVIVEFSRAVGERLAGLRDALSLAPHAQVAAEVQSALEKAKPSTAVAAAVVLANHKQLDPRSMRLAQLLADPDPTVASLAWRAALLADSVAPKAAPERPFKLAVAAEWPGLRAAAWQAAAWTGQAQALAPLRQAAAGDAVALHWLAILGSTDDAPVIQKAALAMPDAQARCELLARFGHPSALNALVRWMGGDDVALAHASGEAFTRMTGIEIRGERRRMPVAEGADEFTREMAPDIWMPDVQKARTLMERHGAEWSASQRWCAGRRMDDGVSREQLPALDLEARWDVAARAALVGRPVSAPPPIH